MSDDNKYVVTVALDSLVKLRTFDGEYIRKIDRNMGEVL